MESDNFVTRENQNDKSNITNNNNKNSNIANTDTSNKNNKMNDSFYDDNYNNNTYNNNKDKNNIASNDTATNNNKHISYNNNITDTGRTNSKTNTNIACSVHERFSDLIQSIDLVPQSPHPSDPTFNLLVCDGIKVKDGPPIPVNTLISPFKERLELPRCKHNGAFTRQKSWRTLELERLAEEVKVHDGGRERLEVNIQEDPRVKSCGDPQGEREGTLEGEDRKCNRCDGQNYLLGDNKGCLKAESQECVMREDLGRNGGEGLGCNEGEGLGGNEGEGQGHIVGEGHECDDAWRKKFIESENGYNVAENIHYLNLGVYLDENVQTSVTVDRSLQYEKPNIENIKTEKESELNCDRQIELCLSELMRPQQSCPNSSTSCSPQGEILKVLEFNPTSVKNILPFYENRNYLETYCAYEGQFGHTSEVLVNDVRLPGGNAVETMPLYCNILSSEGQKPGGHMENVVVSDSHRPGGHTEMVVVSDIGRPGEHMERVVVSDCKRPDGHTDKAVVSDCKRPDGHTDKAVVSDCKRPDGHTDKAVVTDCMRQDGLSDKLVISDSQRLGGHTDKVVVSDSHRPGGYSEEILSVSYSPVFNERHPDSPTITVENFDVALETNSTNTDLDQVEINGFQDRDNVVEAQNEAMSSVAEQTKNILLLKDRIITSSPSASSKQPPVLTPNYLTVPSLTPKPQNNLVNTHVTGSVLKRPMLRHVSQPNMATSRSVQLARKQASRTSNSTSSSTCSKYSENDLDTDLSRLKATAKRLNLLTRRPSYMKWLEARNSLAKMKPPPPLVRNLSRDLYLKLHGGGVRSPSPPVFWRVSTPCCSKEEGSTGSSEDCEDCKVYSPRRWREAERLTEERKQRINKSLEWIRAELEKMRSQDQTLAKQLMSTYREIHTVRLKRHWQEHRDLLDEVRYDLEELYEVSNVLDLPRTCLLDTPLKHVGVTKLNISARRFSTC